jgi:hypothetical protein
MKIFLDDIRNPTDCLSTVIKNSIETQTHPKCLATKQCQETEGFKGTEHEGVDVCEDGCVWYKPPLRLVHISNGLLDVYYSENGKFLGQFIRDVDGYFYFKQSNEGGLWSFETLTIIAESLKVKNRKWDERVMKGLQRKK